MTPMRPIILDTVAQAKAWRQSQSGIVGFVPTMGALHEGHAELLRNLRPRCDQLVLSIFVNPTQFGPKEDFSKYPRTFEKDLEIARREGVDAVFAPTPDVMYPEGYSTYVEETVLSAPLCGTFRPGHFRGVTTVVLKLFNILQPRVALFGLKDAQQYFVLKKMARDLDLDVEVEGMSTVREPDGLALSSRNAYLSPEERKKAPLIYQTLTQTAQKIRNGAFVEVTLDEARTRLQEAGFQVQYLEFLTLPGSDSRLLAIAAYLGTTRLIDNVILD